MFLCRGIFQQSNYFPMVGVFPLDVVMEPKPQGHGYTIMECVADNPFFPKGQQLKGHEFHYSRVLPSTDSLPLVFRLSKGQGIVNGWDGLCYRNTLASYSHLHALGNDSWVEAMVKNALQFHEQQDSFPEPVASSMSSTPRVLQVSKRQTII
jgi:cobyrinic acid a,c-diamide synthase